MPIANENILLDTEQYLSMEQTSEIKHEFINGYVYAMTGVSRAHNFISGNLYAAIRAHLRGQSCRVYMSDMKVHVHTSSDEVFYYPDVMVACDKNPNSEYYEQNPSLIIEVLSDSTEAKDRLEKLNAYTRLVSLQEYALVSQYKVSLDIYRKFKNKWVLNSYSAGESVNFDSIALDLQIESIYEDVIGKV